jgi:hypothetical protein
MESKLPDRRVESMPLQTRRPVTNPQPFPPRRDYSSLSIRDLLDARDAPGGAEHRDVRCLVRRAGSYYALTNRHVAGGQGEEVRAVVRRQTIVVGRTSDIAVDRLLMNTVFPEWAGARTYLTLDAGLVRIENIHDWTSQAYGIGEIGEVFDATSQSVTLDLVGCAVRAFGGASGVAEGEIRALFFRYQSLGGFDYATDVLIGPRRGHKGAQAPPLTRPGDSGTIWFYDPPVNPPDPGAPEDESLARICREEHESFVPSLSLDEMAESGRFEPPS